MPSVKSVRLILPSREIVRLKREPIQTYHIRNGRVERGRLVLEHRARSRLPAPFIISPLRETMAVAFDAQSTTDNRVAAVATSSDTNLTVGSGANRALIVQIAWGAATPPNITGVHWDSAGTNQACTLITGTDATFSQMRVSLYGLIAPTSGNKTLKVDWAANATDGYVSAVAYTGVDQTGGDTSFAHGATGSGTNNAVSKVITSAVGNAVVGVLDTNLVNITSTSGTNVYIDNGGGASSAAAMRDVGAATVTLTAAPNNTWLMAGCDVVAAGGAAAVSNKRTVMGAGI